jgi:hypothetical protein
MAAYTSSDNLFVVSELLARKAGFVRPSMVTPGSRTER